MSWLMWITITCVGPQNVNFSTNVIRPLKCYNFFFIKNVKRIIDSRDAKCENGLKKGGGVTAEKIELVASRFGTTYR